MREQLGIPDVHARKAVENVGHGLRVAVRVRNRACRCRHVRKHSRYVVAALGVGVDDVCHVLSRKAVQVLLKNNAFKMLKKGQVTLSAARK